MAQHKVDIYMPLYVRDFLTSTLGWSAEERGHYLVLLMVAWDRGSLPDDIAHLERLSPGVGQVWHLLADKFPVCEDGQRRNARLEKHRDRCVELKEKRVEAARRAAAGKAAAAAARANGEQTQSNRGANGEQTQSNRDPNVIHPTSTSTSTPTSTSLREEINTHTHGGRRVLPARMGGRRVAAVRGCLERHRAGRALAAPHSPGRVDGPGSVTWLAAAGTGGAGPPAEP